MSCTKKCWDGPIDKIIRYVQFKHGDRNEIGVQLLENGEVYPLSGASSTIPNSMVEFLSNQSLAKEVPDLLASICPVPYEEVQILAPITKPDKVVCVGLNYKDVLEETKKPVPSSPMIFNKFPSCIIGPNDDIALPEISNKVDWEVELVVVVGRQCKNICESDADNYIFGYTIGQDISARDWQLEKNNGQILLGKAMDCFCPLGPAIIPKEFINVSDLSLKTIINGCVKQDGRTSSMIFNPPFLVSYVSQIVTLYPGDIVMTGTPMGYGHLLKPPEYLKRGDVLESEIEGIGRMKNVCR